MSIEVTPEQARDFAEAHMAGHHSPPDGVPREGCPACKDEKYFSIEQQQEGQQ